MTLNFKQQYTLEQRLHKINRIFERYPDRVPIVIEKINEGGLKAVSPAAERSIEKKIFLVRCELTICQFSLILRKKNRINTRKGTVFIYRRDNPIKFFNPRRLISSK